MRTNQKGGKQFPDNSCQNINKMEAHLNMKSPNLQFRLTYFPFFVALQHQNVHASPACDKELGWKFVFCSQSVR